MSTITLPNIRVGSDLQVRVRLKDGGVAIDWSTLQNIKACIYSDAQRALAGRCSISIDAEDSTLLVCNYAANKPQYLGANRVVISVKYLGETKTYDKPAFTFVRWTDDQAGEQITIDDPDVDVEIEVEDISSSILQEAVDAAFEAADRANDAAAAAEHMVDIHTGPEGKSAYEVAVEEGYVGTEEEWLASLVGPQGAQGIQGETGEAAGFGTVSVSLQEDGGQPSATVAASGTDTAKNFAFTFNNLKGEKGDKGDQGNTGSSVEYPYELVNNCTTNDATKGLAASQGVALASEVSQLEAKVTDLEENSIKIIVDINGGGDYTSLSEAVLYATGFDGATIYINPGVYDIITEFEALYGNDFFTNYSSSVQNRGIVLKNGVRLFFSPGSKVECKYAGNNASVRQLFAPFNSGPYGFVLDGCTIDMKNCRYCIHDERYMSTDSYINVIRNCVLHSDNSESDQTFRAVIGGGLGKNGNIHISDCVFSSEGLTEARGIVTYHNNAGADSKSFVVIDNNVFEGYGSFYAHYYGESTEISQFIVSNNKFEYGYVLPVDKEADATIVNVQVEEFNNTGKHYDIYATKEAITIENAPISSWEYSDFFLLSNNTFSKAATNKNVFIPLNGGEQIQVDLAPGNVFLIAALKSLPSANGDSADYATGGSRTGGANLSFVAPSDAKYLYVSVEYNGTNWCPAAIRVNGYDYIKGVRGEILNAEITEGLTTSPVVNSVLKEMVVLRTAFDPSAIKNVMIRRNYRGTNGKYYYGIYFYDNNPGNVIGQVQEIFDVSTEIEDYVMANNDVALFLSFGDFADGESRYNVTIREQNIGLHSSPLLREYYYGDSLKKLNPTITDHYFILATDGTIAGNGTTTAGKYTSQFFVPAGATLYVYANGSSTMAIISACDSAGNNIVPLVAGEGVTKEYKYTFDRDSYARASGSNSANVPFVILLASNSNIAGLKKEVNGIRIITDKQRLTDNDTINDIVQSLYIPSSEVSAEILATTTLVRLYNGYGGLYGVALYDSGNNVVKYIRISSDSAPTDIIEQDGCYADVDFSKVSASYVDYHGVVLNVDTVQSLSAQPGLYATLNSKRIAILAQDETYFKELGVSPIMNYGERPVLYSGDTKAVTNHIVNAVMYPNGVIIAARVGSVVRINLDGTEETLLTIAGASDWRGLFLDKDNNVYASPHASFGSPGGFQMTSRGLYRLAYGQSSFVKVISLYDPNSQNPTEAEQNDDTIWTMCQDRDGYLYAGVYCHTQRYAPRIYRSTDGGITWVDYFDFTTILPNGHHVHSIIFNDYNNALYCIVGEVNTVLKSTDHGTTWENLNVVCEGDKGSAMIAVKDGVIIGSDGAYDCQLSKLYADDKTVKTVGSFWANTIFAIRKSDVTGWLYAFTKIDSSVNVTSYMPPIAAITDESALATWIASAPSQLANWQRYHNRVKDYYPDDAIRPQHCGILISKDNGETWEALYYKFVTSIGPSGFVTTGYFRNGECLSGLFEDTGDGMAVVNPIIISEGKHKYGANGLTLDGEILIRTNTSDNITPL